MWTCPVTGSTPGCGFVAPMMRKPESKVNSSGPSDGGGVTARFLPAAPAVSEIANSAATRTVRRIMTADASADHAGGCALHHACSIVLLLDDMSRVRGMHFVVIQSDGSVRARMAPALPDTVASLLSGKRSFMTGYSR